MMKSKLVGIGLVIICTFLTTIAQLFFKLGSSTVSFSITSIIFNYFLIIGLASYGLSAILFILALRLGELSFLYPFWALSFVWISLVSMVVLNESVGISNWVGIAFIVTGISFIGFGARNG